MTRTLLDTSIIGNVNKPQPSPLLLIWLFTQPDDALPIATLTLAETRRGILDKPLGRKRDALEAWFLGPEGPQALFAGRILPFDAPAALLWSRLMSDGRAAGHPRSPLDMIIAATAAAHACTVATDNERDFAGLPFLNPLRPPP